jgi:glycosyltransferase involved in cell wall biosynthesis
MRLLLVGEGPLREKLRRLACQLGLLGAVVFAGSREDVADLLGAMDLYVSSSRSEAMSNAILEAMSVGLPVVATNVGDNADLLGAGRAGVIVPPSDAALLARAMLTASRDRAGCRRLGELARRRVLERYTFQYTVSRYLRLYGRLAAGPSGLERHTRSTRRLESPSSAGGAA